MRAGVLGILALAFACGVARSAYADLTCLVNVAVTPQLRHEGLVELTGDIVLVCSGTAPESGITGPLTVTLNTEVTSRLLGGTSEALLLINEPPPGSQTLGTNLFEGVVSGNTVTFNNVPFAPPPGGTITNRVLRITNVRADVTSLVVGTQAAPVSATVSTTLASIDITSPRQIVGFVQDSFLFSPDPVCTGPDGIIEVRFTELFGTAFKIQGMTNQDVPGTIYNTESGFTPNPFITGVGLADSGTELGLAISGLPPGAHLSVPPAITEGMLTIKAIQPPGGGIVPVVGGAATIVYEVTIADPNQSQGITIPITTSGVVVPLPPGAVGPTVRGTLYPISTVATASATDPIPRFVDASTPQPFGRECRGAPVMGAVSLVALGLGLLGIGVLMVRRRSTS